MESFTRHEEKAAAMAVGVIVEILEADAVWLFAVRSRFEGCSGSLAVGPGMGSSVHLYLLAFAAGVQDGAEQRLSRAIEGKSGGRVTATVLVYNAARLSRVKGNHRAFLGKVAAGSVPLFVKKGYVIPEFVNVNPNRKAQQSYWNHCKYMAVCCLEAENAIENPNGEPLQAILIGQAVGQVCLGVIYALSGCRPANLEVRYLLELCGLFFSAVSDIFPRGTVEEEARLAVLGLRMESLRYRGGQPSVTDIEVLRSRAHRLLAAAGEAVELSFAAGVS